MTAQPATVRPYADHVGDYALAGWPCIIPVPAETKTPPPGGFTGAGGKDTEPLDLVGFIGPHAPDCVTHGKGACDRHERGHYSVALRMPDGVIGIDVDQYVKAGAEKHGAVTLAAHLERWGQLPATWTSTARGAAQPSRIYFFRVPSGRYASNLAGGDVEIIQRHHRYAVVAPSFHHDAEAPYSWYDPTGAASDRVPSPAELPFLPELWVAGLAEGATDQGPAAAGHDEGRQLLDQLLADDRDQCSEIYSALVSALEEFNRADAGSRHDTMTGRVHGLVMHAALGHAGVGSALRSLGDAWAAKTPEEGRGHEFVNMMLTSARKAVTVSGVTQIPHDPCWFGEDYAAYSAPAPEMLDEQGNVLPEEPIEPPRWWSNRQLIGTAAFDPRADTDQPLGEAVLRRMFPALRYAYDAKTWLLRGVDSWEAVGDLTEWAVAQVAPLMPHGNLDAEKNSDDYARAKRRTRLLTANSSGAVAKKMRAVVAGGTHPVAIRLADLDSDPAILWAGGMPWSLRDSCSELIVADPARVDPSTPHLHSAGVTPHLGPTPLWDALLAAVWPDPEIRAYALRVLSIALTGYADRALPILMGETGRGKTQVVTLLMSVLGSYAHAANPKLLEPRSNEHDTIIYALKGRRLSFIDEGPSEARAGQERLKQLTGGGELTARQMNQDPITFRPSHTLVMTTNDEPVLTDPAVRARTRLIPCDGDPELVSSTRAAIGHVSSTAWRTEAPGVLAAMMLEAGRWLDDPSSALITSAPGSISFLAERLGAEQDPITVWLTEETEPFEEGTPSRELYQAFVASCRRNSMRFDAIPSETKWGRSLNRLGVASRHTEHGKVRPIRIRPAGPAWISTPTPTMPVSISPDGLTPSPDGFLTGSEANPSAAKPQVTGPFPQNPDGLTGLETNSAHVHAQARALARTREADPKQPVNPSTRQDGDCSDLPPVPEDPTPGATVFDLETGSVEELCSYGPGYVRLGGYLHGDAVQITAEADRLARYLEKADLVTGHNILGFDLLALARYHGLDFHAMVERGAVFDTLLAARQIDPPRARSNKGYDLDSLAERLGFGGKAHDLRKLAREFGGFDKIPLDDPRYREYLTTDVQISLGVYSATAINDPYLRREHRVAALAGQITLNGFAVNRDLLDERLTEVAAVKSDALAELAEQYGIPITDEKGRPRKSPLASDAGKAALEVALTQLGVTHLPRTEKTGTLVTAGETMTELGQQFPAAARLCDRVRTVTGSRTIYGTIDSHTIQIADGRWRVHPGISFEQSTGRASTTKPGLTVVGKRGERYHERDVFEADPGEVMLSVDLAQVDARAVAALSGDQAYQAMFAPGLDLHAEVARRVWRDPSRREQAKPLGHGWNYGMGLTKLSSEASVDYSVAEQFDIAMRYQFPRLVEWRDEVREIAASGQLLDNGFGRKMNPDPHRAHTQGPAFMGQGAARDLMMEGLLRLDREVYSMLRGIVHDEVVMSVPIEIRHDVAKHVAAAMSFEWRGVPIVAEPQKNKDGSVRFGTTWGSLYAKETA